MASGKYSRVDSRKSSSYCSAVTVVVFVGVCLVGVWILMSSPVGPDQNSELPSPDTQRNLEQKVKKNDPNQFEDSPGDLPEDATKEEETKVEKFVKESTEGKTDSEGEMKRDAENEEEKKEELESNAGESESNSGGGDSNSGDGDSNSEGGETNANEQSELEENPIEVKLNLDEGEKKPDAEENAEEINHEDKVDSQTQENHESQHLDSEENSEILSESSTQNGPWATQAAESENEKESQKFVLSKDQKGYKWKLCNVTAGQDYIPCLDNVQVVRRLPNTKHYEHRERHCPDQAPTCVVPLPEGYKRPIKWPKSREQIWYYNVPHPKLAEVKGHQNWVKVNGDYLTFPGGGTQFKNGALHYIDFINTSLPQIAWGKRSRVLLDVGCGVASFGGYLFERDALAISFAPKDEHEAQVQFALERGIPAFSAVMGTKRLPFPSKVFDVVHCARCRVPWHIEGGKLLLELNRLLRPGGYFVWSATPVYRKDPVKDAEDVEIWNAMSELTKSMCWDLVVIKKDVLNEVGAAFYRKPTSNECYESRPKNEPPLCHESDDPNAAWNVPLQACIHKAPTSASERGSKWPEQWPRRVEKAPYWLKSSQVGVYGKAAPEDFATDYEHWKHVVSKSYISGMGIDWSSVRNVMDMRAVYGGFAAALKDLKVWVMNIVPINSPDMLPIIYERGLFGMYHDWCESFSTYPRTYDLLHADHLFSDIKKRCNLVAVIAEVDRILRPEGHLIVRDKGETIAEVESLARTLQWKIRLTYSKDGEGLLCVQKSFWRPTEAETIMSAIA